MTTRSQLTRRIVRAMPVEELRERCEEVRAYLDAKIRALEDDALECTCHDDEDDDSDEVAAMEPHVIPAHRSVEPVYFDCEGGRWCTNGHWAAREGELLPPSDEGIWFYREDPGLKTVLDVPIYGEEAPAAVELRDVAGTMHRKTAAGVWYRDSYAKPWEGCVWKSTDKTGHPLAPRHILRDGVVVAVVMPRRPL